MKTKKERKKRRRKERKSKKQRKPRKEERSKKEVKIKSPKDKGNYAESWTITTRNNKKGTYSKVVYNKEYPSLTHLLEFGHATKNGGYVNPQPHIRETEDKYREKFVEEFEREAKR